MIDEKKMWMNLWKGFTCLFKGKKHLDISLEVMSIDYNEGEAEKGY